MKKILFSQVKNLSLVSQTIVVINVVLDMKKKHVDCVFIPSWRPRDFNHLQLCAYRDNHSASWANPSSLLHKSRLQSPEQTTARKRRRPNSNESNPHGFDSNPHGFEMNARDFDSNRERLDSSSCAFNFNRQELESNPRNMDWQSAYRCGDSQSSSLQYSERSYVLSPNSRARDQAGVQPRRTDYGNRGFNKVSIKDRGSASPRRTKK